MNSTGKKRIILAGGGTLGSVSPLLAVADGYAAEYLFIGSKTGPEKAKVIEQAKLAYASIPAGKLRRYWSLRNFFDVFKVFFGLLISLRLIRKFKPDLILTAGSFVAVPVAWAGWLCRVPVVVHQQDMQLGLANRLMSPFARRITVTFYEQQKLFARKTVVTGNPVRLAQVKGSFPIIVITGGGLGARGFNKFITPYLSWLTKYYPVHHILGDKNYDQRQTMPNYFPYRFVTAGMDELLSRAELIISRAGMSIITEAAAGKKAMVLIPMPNSHQYANAEFFAKRNAAVLVKQGSDKILERYLQKLLDKDDLRQHLGANLHNLFPVKAIDNYRQLIEDILS